MTDMNDLVVKWALPAFIINLCAVAVLQYQMSSMTKNQTAFHESEIELARRGQWMLSTNNNIEGLLKISKSQGQSISTIAQIQKESIKAISKIENTLDEVVIDVALLKQRQKNK